MTRFGIMFCALLLVSGGTTCEMGPPGTNPPPDNSNLNGNGNDNSNGNSNDLVRITLRLQSLEEGSTLKRVYVSGGENPHTRANMPYDSAFNAYTTEHTADQVLFGKKGEWISFVAFDTVLSHGSGVSTIGTTPEVLDYPDYNEFVRWDGDFETGNVGDLGELSFQIDRERTIIAVYQRMSTYEVRAFVDGVPYALPSIRATLQISNFLSFPDESGPRTIEWGFGVGDGLGRQQIGAARTGSVLTLVPSDSQPNPDLKFLSWSDDCGGGGCSIEIGASRHYTATSNWTEH